MPPLPYARYVALPDVWPGRQRPDGWRPKRSPFQFKAWSRVERELLEEIGRVNGRDATIALDVRAPGQFKADGGIRADARPVTSRVIVSFTRPDGKRLVFPCDAYGDWHDNVWAIRLSLEALRAVDRYGVTQGDRQYEGFAALPPARFNGMTVDRARSVIADLTDVEPAALRFKSVLTMAVQRARARTHPDREGGSEEKFKEVETAARILESELAQ
jgi:hypothetical protein